MEPVVIGRTLTAPRVGMMPITRLSGMDLPAPISITETNTLPDVWPTGPTRRVMEVTLTWPPKRMVYTPITAPVPISMFGTICGMAAPPCVHADLRVGHIKITNGLPPGDALEPRAA